MTYPLPAFRRTLATSHRNSASDAPSLAVKSHGISGHDVVARNRRNGEGKRGGRSVIRRKAVAALKSIFSTGPTASEIGKLGNAVKREQQRAKVRAKCDEMREKMGLPAARWPQ